MDEITCYVRVHICGFPGWQHSHHASDALVCCCHGALFLNGRVVIFYGYLMFTEPQRKS